MQLVNDFFNKAAGEIRVTYFSTVKYYRDDKNCTDVSYALELFNNGCLTYTKLINRLVKGCKDTKENITAIVDKYIIFN